MKLFALMAFQTKNGQEMASHEIVGVFETETLARDVIDTERVDWYPTEDGDVPATWDIAAGDGIRRSFYIRELELNKVGLLSGVPRLSGLKADK